MSVLTILQFPDVGLKKVAKPVDRVDSAIRRLVENLWETMYAARGVGLAATQVAVQQRILVMDVSANQQSPMVLINPQIIQCSGEFRWEEGCLSLPGVYAKVKRAQRLEVAYVDLDNRHRTLLADNDLLSVCVQHEIDHLNGITFYDHLSPLKQRLLRDKLKKIREKRL